MSEDRDATAVLRRFSQHLLDAALKPLWQGGGLDTAEIIKSLAAGAAEDTERWRELQQRFYSEQIEAWARLATADPAQPARSIPVLDDRRFRAPEWRHPYFNYLAESYL